MWLGVYGDGSDGVGAIAGPTTLTRDMYYSSLIIDAGITLTPGGFRIFCTGTLTNNGIIDASGGAGGNGGAGGAGAAGVPTASGALASGQAGQIGRAPTAGIRTGGSGAGGGMIVIVAKTIINNNIIRANGGAGGNAYFVTPALTQQAGLGPGAWAYSFGSVGGAGGGGTSPAVLAGGPAGAVTAPAVYGTGYRSIAWVIGMRAYDLDAATNQLKGGSGGGEGCYDSNATYGVVGGSGGGGGGVVALVYSTITLGTVQVNGGVKGTKVVIGIGAGSDGNDGSVGKIIQVVT